MVTSHGRQTDALAWKERAQRRQNGRTVRKSCLLPAHATAKQRVRTPARGGEQRGAWPASSKRYTGNGSQLCA
ncbi:hypothetical protein BER93_06175 [Xanthomonas fragariae]|nr:hypothetical protein BER92_06165 [Xanthomonas fragariae]AOD17777.1 hypothetical protein BER93_06175 [Xanthomonas fragariae]ENZ94641.1 hypothetical protein O1K_14450 [Xanthomonas fragariae LMG 25863]